MYEHHVEVLLEAAIRKLEFISAGYHAFKDGNKIEFIQINGITIPT